MESKEKLFEVLTKLCNIIDEANLNKQELHELTCNFLFTIGNSLENNPSLQSSELVLQKYAEHPTFGNALMAQSLWIRDTWKIEEKEVQDDRRQSGNVRGTEQCEIAGPTTVQDLQGNQG